MPTSLLVDVMPLGSHPEPRFVKGRQHLPDRAAPAPVARHVIVVLSVIDNLVKGASRPGLCRP